MRKIQWWKKREENMAKQKRVAVRKDRKGMTNEKKKLLDRRKFLFSIPSGVLLSGDYFMLAATIHLQNVLKSRQHTLVVSNCD